MRTMFVNGPGLAVWLGVLLAVNFVVPLVFVGRLEAQVVLFAGMAGALVQMLLFRAKGFVRLLGIGHVPWIPMVPWLWMRLDQAAWPSAFGFWLVAVIVLDGLSLILDVTDVLRYLGGERTPHLTVPAENR